MVDIGKIDPNSLGNDAGLEQNWAIKAFQHAETHLKLLQIPGLDPASLKLTKHDDMIYEKFRELFPDMDVDVIDEEEMKSDENKELWRPFLMSFENIIADFNFLTLLRINSEGVYEPDNTTVVPRVQFYCIEIARSREKVNLGQKNNNNNN
eukprot:TRINITY_DN7582_c0_g1_i1.p1 TRINITY_DN7582_c0_g1~~TRINITY_DN7582_c0_g1_i1.p1  ORF type:complete len:151 (+),score=48.45 TRINITY_DN7582_c0_g1_i1:50-502(+)